MKSFLCILSLVTFDALSGVALAAPTVKREAAPEAYHGGYHSGYRYDATAPSYGDSDYIRYGVKRTASRGPAMIVDFEKRDLTLAKRGVCTFGNDSSCNFQCTNNVSINCPNGSKISPYKGSCGGIGGLVCQCYYSTTCQSGGGPKAPQNPPSHN